MRNHWRICQKDRGFRENTPVKNEPVLLRLTTVESTHEPQKGPETETDH
jgi:hypothetical protein